jgi:hypothetical protein
MPDSRSQTARDSASQAKPAKKGARSRAFSGLVLVFLLSFLSLIGILLTMASLGGLGAWTRWQFIGLFGVIEVASGIANIIAPNIWRLSVVELTSDRNAKAKLTASTMLIPHWGGGARAIAGTVLIVAAGSQTASGPISVLLIPLILLLAALLIAVSAILARAGTAWPDYDVIQVMIRWAKKEQEVTPISLSASLLQFLLSIVTIPLVKTMQPGALYQPEIAPSLELLVGVLIATVLSVIGMVVVWGDRVEWRAARWQQREAEQNA